MINLLNNPIDVQMQFFSYDEEKTIYYEDHIIFLNSVHRNKKIQPVSSSITTKGNIEDFLKTKRRCYYFPDFLDVVVIS